MAIPSRPQDQILMVVSKLKQANYATLVSDANLQSGKRFAPLGPAPFHPALAFENTLQLAGKGHDYVTQQWETERNAEDTLNFLGDSWILGWLLAFAMGSVSSVQPNAGGNPTAWKHTIKPLDPGTAGKDIPVTTIYREWAATANAKGRINSVCVAGVSIEFPPSQALRCSGQMFGSGQETLGALATPPALVTLVQLLANDLTFKRGTQGAPTDITSRLVRGSLKFSFGWNPDQENSRAPGGGLYRSRIWVGTPQPVLEWSEFVDDADVAVHETNYKTQTVEEVKVNVQGAQIATGPEKHELEIRILAAVPKITGKAQSGDKWIYSFRVGLEDMLKQGAADVITTFVQNTETSYLV